MKFVFLFFFFLTLTFSHYFEFLLFCLTAMTIRWRNNSAGLYHRSRAQVLRRSYTEGKKKEKPNLVYPFPSDWRHLFVLHRFLHPSRCANKEKAERLSFFFHFLVFCFRLAMSLLFVGKTKKTKSSLRISYIRFISLKHLIVGSSCRL